MIRIGLDALSGPRDTHDEQSTPSELDNLCASPDVLAGPGGVLQDAGDLREELDGLEELDMFAALETPPATSAIWKSQIV